MTDVPASHRDLLDAQVGTFGTIGDDGLPQLSEVWFLYEDGDLRISLNTSRAKTKNLDARPECSLLILDLENPYRYLEVRGVVEEIVPDPTGAFYLHLNDRYTGPLTEPPVDKADRVILVVRPTGYSKQ